jgi:hypothetical protein
MASPAPSLPPSYMAAAAAQQAEELVKQEAAKRIELERESRGRQLQLKSRRLWTSDRWEAHALAMEEQEEVRRTARAQLSSLSTLLHLPSPSPADFDNLTAELVVAQDKVDAVQKAQAALESKVVECEGSRADVKQLIVWLAAFWTVYRATLALATVFVGMLVAFFPSASPVLLLAYICVAVTCLIVLFVPRLMYAKAQVRKHRAVSRLPDQQLTASQAVFKTNLTHLGRRFICMVEADVGVAFMHSLLTKASTTSLE